MLGGIASVAGGARNHAGWAWLTGSRVVQAGLTPLHYAAGNGHEAAIKALVAEKANVHAKNDVREGVLGGRGGRRRRVCILLLMFRVWTWCFGKTHSVNLRLNPKPWTLNSNAFNARA